MRFAAELRDPAAARAVVGRIHALAEGRHASFMEICGGHTHTIYRNGLQTLLPESVRFVHGPGCPVCVIPLGRIDDAVAIARTDGVTFCCFGDMLRVPGSKGRSLLRASAKGADVRVVYSPLDALRLAAALPSRQVVFFGVGFETTAPSTAITLLRARAAGVANFSVFCNHVLVVPPIRAILDAGAVHIDGFVGPGHVSTVIGTRPYDFVAREYGRPLVVAGFEPLDVLRAVEMLLAQLDEGRCEVENQYSRVVRPEGNRRALAVMDEVFAVRASFEWRGLGSIPHSGLRLRDEFAAWDAERRFAVPGLRVADPRSCRCGEVLRGTAQPWECGVFGTACTPEHPVGTCMVSSEGACAAYYAYGRGVQVAS